MLTVGYLACHLWKNRCLGTGSLWPLVGLFVQSRAGCVGVATAAVGADLLPGARKELPPPPPPPLPPVWPSQSPGAFASWDNPHTYPFTLFLGGCLGQVAVLGVF